MANILLVEDNAADVFMVREALRHCSIPTDLTIAYDGAEALSYLDDPPTTNRI